MSLKRLVQSDVVQEQVPLLYHPVSNVPLLRNSILTLHRNVDLTIMDYYHRL